MAELKYLPLEIKKEQYKSLLIENIKYKTILTRKYQDKKPYSPKDIKKITAFIPGTITKIYVKPKRKVKIGDKLLVLEAMKMSNDILSPINGTIKGIYIKEGEKVNKEKILIEFD
jgi:biotin carboxyl carrier protein